MKLVATILLCLYLPVPAIMLWIHGPIRLWRRMGNWSYALHAPVYIVLVAAVARGYERWAWGAWEWAMALRFGGAALIAFALVLLALTYRQIDSWTAMAGPQVTADSRRRLLETGIYGVIRHPRYAVLIIGAIGNSLLTGYPLVIAAFAVTAGCTLLVARIEDAELESYFGTAFTDYRGRVPGWIPRR